MERVGLYLRLSRDDERDGESMSIENQRSYLSRCAGERGWTVAGVYTDDGYTGTNFQRPGFQSMLVDIERGAINTVMTKDLSRLGRDQIGTAYYYQVYFPRHRVRYIAVAEGFDTAEPGGTSALFPFLTAANDFYTADISRKVRAALTTRKKEGKFIGANPPLGYRKDPGEAGHLLIEERGAEVVRQVFGGYLSLGSVSGTAKALSEEGVSTPAQCKGSAPGRFPGVWSDTMVRRILSNPTYAGHLTQNRSEKLNYKVERRVSLPPEKWITVHHTHQPIITQEDFDKVQVMLAVRGYQSCGGSPHVLTGLAFCADCGSPMTYAREGKTRTYMVCQGYRKGGRLRLCTSHRVREDEVLAAICEALRTYTKKIDRPALEEQLCRSGDEESPRNRIEQAKRRLEQLERVMDRLYSDWAAGLLEEGEFRSLVTRNREERQRCGREAEARGSSQEGEGRPEGYRQVEQLLSFETIDRPAALALIEKVLVRADKTLELRFRFCQPE